MKLFRPQSLADFTVEQASRFLLNFISEFEEVQFTAEERQQLRKQVFGRLLCASTRRFFTYHFAPRLHDAAHRLLDGRRSDCPGTRSGDRKSGTVPDFARYGAAISPGQSPFSVGSCPRPLIVELGSASGNASILFALLGARVVGLDFDPVMVSAARRRQAIYEQHFGPLALEFRVADAREFDCRALGRIDGVYSLFALNLMQPAARVLSRVLPALGPDARVVISDGNRRNLYNRLFRPRPALSPQELQSFLNRTGLATTCEFHCAVPPLLARSGPLFALAVGLEAAARRSRLLPRLGVSYTLFAQGAA